MSGRTLVTFPGRAGDLLWALPTVRAISEALGQPVDLQVAGEFASMLELLRAQPYLDHVCANPHWGMSQGWEAPMPVGTPEGVYTRVIHLGYRRWPELPLPREVYQTALELQLGHFPLALLDLDRPWITVEPWTQLPHRVAVGWSDCHFELKVGLGKLLVDNWGREGPISVLSGIVLAAPGSRWVTEQPYAAVDLVEAARRIAACQVFLGDCSALHVLACALGKPCVLVEPMEARWNPIFYPLGMDGPRVRVVKGLDGQPTFDARHTLAVLKEVLGAR